MDNRPSTKNALGAIFANSLLVALLEADGREAEAIVRDSLEAGLTPGMVADDVIAPPLTVLGELWAAAVLTPGEEHIASAIVARRLLPLLKRRAGHPGDFRRTRTVLLATPPGELHTIGVEMAAALLEAAGYFVLYAGAELPVQGLDRLIDRYEPDVFAFGLTMSTAADGLGDLLALTTTFGRPVVVGGLAYTAALHYRSDAVACPDLSDVVMLLDHLTADDPPLPRAPA
jgi:methanogenic corrinoid protein MtbC1